MRSEPAPNALEEIVSLTVPVGILESVVTQQAHLEGSLEFSAYLNFKKVNFDDSTGLLHIETIVLKESIN